MSAAHGGVSPMLPSGGAQAQGAVAPESDSSSEGSDEDDKTPAMRAQAEKLKKGFNAPAYWMIAFGSLLAICAGIVNVCCMVHLGTVVSHMTGVVTHIGVELEGVRVSEKVDYAGSFAENFTLNSNANDRQKHMDQFTLQIWLLCSFIFGAFLCGLVIPKNAFNFGGKSFYGVALLGESALLIVAFFLAKDEDSFDWAACFAACASGLQNAMCTMHLGAVVRTTHVTGTATDIGSTSGRAAMILLRRLMSGSPLGYLDRVELGVDLKKLRVLSIVFMSFAFGCYIGAWLYTHFQLKALLVPAAISGICGIAYTFLRETLKRTIHKMDKARIENEMHEVEEALERATGVVKKKTTEKKNAGASTRHEEERMEMVEQMEHALEALHGLQEAIEELDDASDRDEESEGARRMPSFRSKRSERSRN